MSDDSKPSAQPTADATTKATPKLSDRQLKVLDSMRVALKTAPTPERSCGDCARCCEGWLSGTVYGHAFSPGVPCFFMEKTCSIYNDRPADPCKSYQCGWLSADTFPMWMKPSLSSLLISKREERGIPFYVVDQAGDTFDERALNWLVSWAERTSANVEYRVRGEVHRVGSADFVRA